METQVKHYKHHRLFENDAKKLAKQGWVVVTSHEQEEKSGCLRKMTLGIFTVFLPKRNTIVVTYQRDNTD